MAKGFNTVAMHTMWKSAHGVLAHDRDGLVPFTREISHGVWDFDSLNPGYFDNLAWLIAQCYERNLLAMIASCWLGVPKTGAFQQEVKANGEERCYSFGQYLARQFDRFTNIIWIQGGDKVPSIQEAACQHKIMEGIANAANGSVPLQCAHWRRPTEACITSLETSSLIFLSPHKKNASCKVFFQHFSAGEEQEKPYPATTR